MRDDAIESRGDRRQPPAGPPHRQRTAEADRTEIVPLGAGRVERRADPPREGQRERVRRSGRHVRGHFLENPLDAAVEIAGGDVQHAHQKRRRGTSIASLGSTSSVRSLLTLNCFGLPSTTRVMKTPSLRAYFVKPPAALMRSRTVLVLTVRS